MKQLELAKKWVWWSEIRELLGIKFSPNNMEFPVISPRSD